MRYPNLRYGNPAELEHEIRNIGGIDNAARRLRRSERCIRNYLNGSERVPWWIPEILRLQRYEHHQRMRQMGITAALGRVDHLGNVITFQRPESPPVPVAIDAADTIAPLQKHG